MVWFFDRGADELACEIRRGRQGFEVIVRGPEVTEVESIETPSALLDEIVRVPRALMSEGWRPRSGDPLATYLRKSG